MTRVLLLGLVSLTVACGHKSFDSLCANQVPPPAACNTACDPAPGAQNACPDSFHCAADGKCDTLCTPAGGECGDGYSCTSDGYCMSNGNGSGDPPIDAACPAVHFTPSKVTPSIQLLIDRSGSMANNFLDQKPAAGDPVKYTTVRDALTGPQGVITQLEQQVYFGASLYSDVAPCPTLTTVKRAKGTRAAIDTLIRSQNPGGNTPTPPSIDATVAEFMANPPPAGSPPIIVLATDGLPNKCGSQTSSQTESVAAAANAFAKGIRLFILSVGDTAGTAAHFQAMANAGQGIQPGQPNASYYPASTPAQLAAAFQSIIGGVLSCDLTLNQHVDATDGQGGTVTMNGVNLTYGTDWTLDPDGITIHLLGNACTTLKSSANPVVDAAFACGAVIF